MLPVILNLHDDVHPRKTKILILFHCIIIHVQEQAIVIGWSFLKVQEDDRVNTLRLVYIYIPQSALSSTKIVVVQVIIANGPIWFCSYITYH